MSDLMKTVKDSHPDAWDKITEAQQSLPESPVDIFGLCKRIGVPTKKRVDLEDNLSGYIIREPGDGFQIFYNGNHPRTRQRFTVAHELAHYLLHQKELSREKPENVLFYPENVLLRGGLPNRLEMEANRLGAKILMPDKAIDAYTAARDEAIISIPEMAGVFDVSPAAMSIRLGIPMDI